jgi:hypothetical protein
MAGRFALLLFLLMLLLSRYAGRRESCVKRIRCVKAREESVGQGGIELPLDFCSCEELDGRA